LDEPQPSHPETQPRQGDVPVLPAGVVGPPESAFGPLPIHHATVTPGGVGVTPVAPHGAGGEGVAPSGGFTQDPPTEPSEPDGDPKAEPVRAEPAAQHVGTLVETGSPLPAPSKKGIDGATVVSIAVVVAGLALVAWMRGRTGGQMGVRGGATATAGADALRRVAEPLGRSPQIPAATSDVDQTAIALAALVREADARIAELTRLRDELGMLGQDRERDSLAALVPGSVESGRGDAAASGARRAAQESRAGANVQFTRPQAAASQHPMPPACADPMADRVYELADSGLSSVEIASALHEHTGKIELILALRRASVGG
jgi:hypothetical protein